MLKKQTTLIIGLAVTAILIAVGLFVYKNQASGPSGGNTDYTTGPAGTTGTSKTREEAPKNIAVPGAGDTNVPKNVAVPAVVTGTNPAGDVSYRTFAVKAENDKFSPDTVIVNQWDTVVISLTAVDDDYGFTMPDYGFNAKILKGTTQKIQFQAYMDGKFIYYCESCGGPSDGPVGYIIIAPKERN